MCSNIDKSYRAKKFDFYDKDLLLRNVRSFQHINGMFYVRKLAVKMKSFPEDVKKKIKQLWCHPNKKRIGLQNLGGTAHKSKGFVIDNRNAVDGLTRRIDGWLTTGLENSSAIDPFVFEFFNVFSNHDSYKKIIKNIEDLDKSKKCKCYNLTVKKMAPM